MRCNQDAFTLWEMLLTISLITTIALLSWQPLQMWLSMQQLSYVRYNWQQFIFQARQQAIINNTIVAICPLAANNWSGGAYSFFRLAKVHASHIHPTTLSLETIQECNLELCQGSGFAPLV